MIFELLLDRDKRFATAAAGRIPWLAQNREAVAGLTSDDAP
jgi:hypothetical protein